MTAYTGQEKSNGGMLMGRTISYKTYMREQRRIKSIEEVDKFFKKYGYRYLVVYPDVFHDPVFADKKLDAIGYLPLREAKKIVKALEKADDKTIKKFFKELKRIIKEQYKKRRTIR